MKKYTLVLVSLLLSLSFASTSRAVEVLRLKYMSDDDVVATVEFHNCYADPNRTPRDCERFVLVNGKRVQVGEKVLSRLNTLRRDFSYDTLSGGISYETKYTGCKMAGPARGMILEALYLTLDDFKIIEQGRKPVYSFAQNCLFSDEYKPKSEQGQSNARAVLEILNVFAE